MSCARWFVQQFAAFALDVRPCRCRQIGTDARPLFRVHAVVPAGKVRNPTASEAKFCQFVNFRSFNTVMLV